MVTLPIGAFLAVKDVMKMTCMPGIFSWWQLQLGTELLAGKRSSSCSDHHNHDNVHVRCDDFDDDYEDNGHLNGPLEESFAGLAGENAIVEPRDLVSTHLKTTLFLFYLYPTRDKAPRLRIRI